MGRLAGTGALLPGGDWDADDLPVADVVATRALLARELIRLRAADSAPASLPSLVLAPQARALFGVSNTILSIWRDGTSGPWRATLVGSLLAREVSPEVWLLRTTDEPQLAALIDDLLCDVAGSAGAAPLLVPTAALSAADRAAPRSTVDSVADLIGSYGVAAADARTTARILLHRDAITTVRLTSQAGTTTVTSSLTWLEVGTETWLAAPDAPADPDDALDGDAGSTPAYLPLPDELAGVTRLTPVGRDDVRAALDALLADRAEGGS
jgi:hypothetical protein